jgi:hypothetical protein
MAAKYLWELGSMILIVLGSIHLYYTFFSNKFSSKNKKLVDEMMISHPILTKETTMWKAWIGFNASHSIGAMFIGIINVFLAHNFFSLLQGQLFFFILNILTVGFYLWLAKKYWFTIPFYGILLTLVCFIVAFIIQL